MTTAKTEAVKQLDRGQWVRLGAIAAAGGVIAVLIVQAVALAIWPDIALFRPLDSYVRSAIFTIVPAIGATALLAWLVAHRSQPVKTFIIISVVFLGLSIIPDYILPDPNRTFLASTVTASLHFVAAAVIIPVLVIGYQRQLENL